MAAYVHGRRGTCGGKGCGIGEFQMGGAGAISLGFGGSSKQAAVRAHNQGREWWLLTGDGGAKESKQGRGWGGSGGPREGKGTVVSALMGMSLIGVLTVS